MAPTTEHISVYLLKDGFDAQDIVGGFEPVPELDSFHEVVAEQTRGVLIVRRSASREPDWIDLLRPVTAPAVSAATQSVRAVLALEVDGRTFAVTFGNGRHLLPSGSFEKKFGLKAALNGVDPEKLRAIAARTFNEHALHTDRQLSQLASVSGFELNTQRDLVTSIEGTVADEDLGKKIWGRDAAHLIAKIEPADLARKCRELYDLSRAPLYREHFPWIDTIEEIEDEDEVDRLTNYALTLLANREFSGFDLMPPEIPDPSISYFKFWPSGTQVVEPTIDLLKYLFKADGRLAATFEHRLRNARLDGVDSSGEVVATWSAFDCLHFERSDSRGLSVLDDGTWYRVEHDFAADVLAFARTLPSSDLELENANQGELEGRYNERIAATRRDLALLDQRLIRLQGQSAIEPCDLFSREGHFVHVKRRKGGSSTLSHLFAQAQVSADSLLLSSEFRKDLRSLLQPHGPRFAQRIRQPGRPGDYKIVLALITQKEVVGPVAASLPFFAKVNLRMVVQRLRLSGFQVFVDQIPTLVTTGTGARPVHRPRRARPSSNRRVVTQA
ncbi:TIGR04141 family sporadically distributed protein [Conexibacter sp. JD483]|uniref:TIGR04141 family sporadically distributed protein n=1 Tax=unclassified Conexibacter TaxID=2627773 RepID=UPI0027272A63|nr:MULTISPECIES: TIGR04141 family sporadically distributed protein [unclassified Conexibacter]MDO8188971.1 TIGR04141 family sporadically distributed protein [Conexibacter sp. CPCC 205706]MDO8201779.1 TIGR04141 family sporadically distributed protein [Conexibacter sp. CPCC 205762]MDR9371444.1 TIGR04141 family sporadically distributed protein [Conexibacter sp. JD483]